METKRINTENPEYIYDGSVTRLMNEIDAVVADRKEVTWHSDGGSVMAGWKFAEYLTSSESKIDANVSGWALSMGSALLPFFNYVRGAKQSWVMIHSPLGGSGKVIDKVAQDLADAFIARIDNDKFKDIAGIDINDVMKQTGDDRKDYWLTGQEAYDIKLYNELFDITPRQEVENRSRMSKMVASAKDDYGFTIPEKVYKTPTDGGSPSGNKNQNVKKMDINKLKAENPDVYNEVYNLGVKAENDRVGSYLVFNDVDPKAVGDGIKSGDAMGETLKNELLRKSVTAQVANGVADGSPEDLVVDVNKTAEQIISDKFESDLKKVVKQ